MSLKVYIFDGDILIWYTYEVNYDTELLTRAQGIHAYASRACAPPYLLASALHLTLCLTLASLYVNGVFVLAAS